MESLFNLAVVLRAVDQLSAPVRRAMDTMQDFDRMAERGRGMVQAGQQATVAGALVQGAAGAMRGALSGPIAAAAQFEAALSNVRAVTAGTQEDFAALEAQALELGRTTAFSASEAADGMSFLGRAGFDAQEVMAGMPAMLAMARAGSMNLASTADIASNILSGFGLEAEELARVGDVLTATFTSANVDIPMLGDTMKYVAPIAREVGASLEETAAMVGMLGNAGIQGSQAGTALRAIFTRLAAPTSRAEAELLNLGVATTDASGNLRGAIDIFQDLQAAMDGMGSADRARTLSWIFGQEAMSGIAELLGQAENIGGYIDEITHSQGRAAEVAAEMGNNFLGARTEMTSALQGMNIAIGNTLLPSLTRATRAIAGIVQGITAWVERNPGLVRVGMTVAAIGAAALSVIAPVLLIGGAFVTSAGYALIATARIGTALVGLYPRLIAASVATGRLAASLWAAATGAAASFAAGLRGLAGVLSGGVRPALIRATVAARAFGAALLTNPIVLIGAAAVGAALLIRKYWQPIAGFFGGLWQGIAAGLAPLRPAFEAIGAAAGPVFDGIAAVVRPAIDAVARLWGWLSGLLAPVRDVDGVAQAMGVRWGEVLGGMIAAVVAVPLRIAEAFLGLPGWFGGVLTDVRSSFEAGFVQGVGALLSRLNPVALLRDLWGGLADWFGGLLEPVRGRVAEIWAGIAGRLGFDPLATLGAAWSGLLGWFSGPLADALRTAGAFFDGLWQGIRSGMEPLRPAFEALSNTVGSAFEAAAGAAQGVRDWFSGLVTPVRDVGDAAGALWDRFRPVLDGIAAGLAPLRPAFEAIGAAARPVFDGIAAVVRPAIDAVARLWGWLSDLLAPIRGAQDAAEGLGRSWGEIVGGMIADIVLLPIRAFEAVAELVGLISAIDLLSVGQAMIDGLVGGIVGGAQAAWEAVTDLASGIAGRFRNFFGIASPSTLFAGFGADIMDGLLDGLMGAVDSVLEAIGSIGSSIASRFRSFLGISSPSTLFAAYGHDIMDGLRIGLLDRIDSVVSAVRDIGASVADRFRSFLGISSPSRVFAGFGGDILDGLVAGIDAGERLAVARAGAMARSVALAAGVAVSAAGAGVSAPALAAPQAPALQTPVFQIPAPVVPEIVAPLRVDLAALELPVPRLAPLPEPRPSRRGDDPAAAGGGSAGAVQVTVNIVVEGSAGRETVAELDAWARRNVRRLARMIEDERRRQQRGAFHGTGGIE